VREKKKKKKKGRVYDRNWGKDNGYAFLGTSPLQIGMGKIDSNTTQHASCSSKIGIAAGNNEMKGKKTEEEGKTFSPFAVGGISRTPKKCGLTIKRREGGPASFELKTKKEGD